MEIYIACYLDTYAKVDKSYTFVVLAYLYLNIVILKIVILNFIYRILYIIYTGRPGGYREASFD